MWERPRETIMRALQLRFSGGWRRRMDIMMVAVFASMALALAAARGGPRWLALTALLVCLALSTGEFVYEIDSPVDGFRLPWLQAMIPATIHLMIRGGQPA